MASKATVENLEKMVDPQSFAEVNFIEQQMEHIGNNNFYELNNIVVSDKMGKHKRLSVGGEEYNAIMKVENKLRQEATKLISYFESSYYKKWIMAIKDYVMSNVDRKLALKKMKKDFMTNEKTPVIRALVDKVVVGLFTGKYTIKVYSMQEKFAKYAKNIQDLIEWGFSSSKTRKTILDAATDAVLLGVGYYRSGFTAPDYEKVTKATFDGKSFSAEAVYPTTEYVSPFSIYADPTRNFYDQPVIFREIYPIDSVLKKKKELIKLDKDQIAIILKSPQRFSSKNYKKVRLIKYHEEDICDDLFGYTLDNFDNYYKLDDKDQMVEYVEYRSKTNLVIAINGYIVYDGPNPLPTKQHPFKYINYTRTPGMWISDGLGIVLSGTQRLYDALFNMMYDVAKLNSGPMYLLKSNQHIEGVGEYLHFDPYKIQKVRGDVNFEMMTVPRGDGANFKVVSDILEMGRMLVSPSIYNELPGVSRSATDAEFRYESLRDNIRPLSESINESFNSLVQDWLLFCKEWMPEEFSVFILGNKGKSTYPVIKRSYLKANYVIETEFDSLKDVNRALEREQITKMLQLLPGIAKDPVDNRILVNMEELFKQVTELFVKDNSFYLTEDEFYKKLAESNKKMQEIQSILAQQQQEAQAGFEKIEQEQGITPGQPSEDELLVMQALGMKQPQ